MSKPWQLSRRTLLRGTGTALALPMLEQMMPSKALAAGPGARRLMAIHFPYGVHRPTWTPINQGVGYTLTPSLAPLAPIRNKVTVITGLANRAGAPVPGSSAAHPCGMGAFITAQRPVPGPTNLGNGISVDQVAANHLRQFTPIPSLQLGPFAPGYPGDCQGYSCVYMGSISWTSPTTPAARDADPRVVFDRLVANGRSTTETDAAAAKRKRNRLSVLDSVRSETQSLQSRLGTGDTRKLDQYLTSVREVEQRVQALDTTITRPACIYPTAPATGLNQWGGSFDKFPEYHATMLDLVALAFQCDLTRVATYSPYAGNHASPYTFLGIQDAHHDISHAMASNWEQKWTQINTYLVQHFTRFLQKLDAMQEPDGSVLDNSIIYYGSEVAGGGHNVDDLPVLLAGTGGRLFQSGRHVVLPREESIANLFIGMLYTVGVNVPTFGLDGTRILSL